MAGEEKVRRYRAFIAYSHRDRRWANWLHRRLEFYRVPHRLVGRRTSAGAITRRLTPVFRDREELATADDLGEKISQALENSDSLIVVCSPAAASSKWVNEEILRFKRSGRGDRILCLIVGGEPLASENGAGKAAECFPPALRRRIDEAGKPVGEPVEPLAADIRPGGDGRGLALMKLIAGMLDVNLDELRRRELQRRNRRWAAVAALSLAVMTATSLLALEATFQRNLAERRRAQAESLVAFMLGNLRTELQPIGRLDLLDMIGKRALAYYSSQDPNSLDSDSLERRARALRLIGQVDNLRGHLDAALSVFEQASATTARLLALKPDDPQRIYDHAQSVSWLAYIDWQRGDLERAESEYRHYGSLADRLVRIDPHNPKWQGEVGDANVNLGSTLLQENKVQAASAAFRKAVSVYVRLAREFPHDADRQYLMGQTRGWLADAEEKLGRFEDARKQRLAELTVYREILRTDPGNNDARSGLATCNRGLAHLAISRGDLDGARERLQNAINIADALIAQDSGNTFWQEIDAAAYVDLGEVLYDRNEVAAASKAVANGERIARELVKKDPGVIAWQTGLLARSELLQARLEARGKDHAGALALAKKVSAKLESLPANKQHTATVLNMTLSTRLFLGDELHALGRKGSAEAWNDVLAIAEASPGYRPPATLTLMATAYARLGRTGEAHRIVIKLEKTGYRAPDFMKLKNLVSGKSAEQVSIPSSPRRGRHPDLDH